MELVIVDRRAECRDYCTIVHRCLVAVSMEAEFET